MPIPSITWGASFANTIDIGYPIDNVTTWSQPRDGSEFARSPAGTEDAWIVGTDYYLAGDIRWIPGTDATAPAVATGWDGTTGWRAALEWMREKNQLRWIPDKDTPGTYILSYLVEPITQPSPGIEPDGSRRMTLVLRSPAAAYDGY